MSRHSEWCKEHCETSSHATIPIGGYKSTLKPDYKKEKQRLIKEQKDKLNKEDKEKCQVK